MLRRPPLRRARLESPRASSISSCFPLPSFVFAARSQGHQRLVLGRVDGVRRARSDDRPFCKNDETVRRALDEVQMLLDAANAGTGPANRVERVDPAVDEPG